MFAVLSEFIWPGLPTHDGCCDKVIHREMEGLMTCETSPNADKQLHMNRPMSFKKNIGVDLDDVYMDKREEGILSFMAAPNYAPTFC